MGEGIDRGWAQILTALKTLLETGLPRDARGDGHDALAGG